MMRANQTAAMRETKAMICDVTGVVTAVTETPRRLPL